MAETNLKIGLDTNSVCDLAPLVEGALQLKFDYLAVPLFHPRHTRDGTAGGVSARRAERAPATRSDLVVNSGVWSRHIIGKVSPWLRPDAACARVRRSSEAAFCQEVAWATHLSLPAVLLPEPASCECANYARLVNNTALQASFLQLWVEVTLGGGGAGADEGGEGGGGGDGDVSMEADDAVEADGADPHWSAWNRMRMLCDSHPSLGVVLVLGDVLPPPRTL
eukprot:g7208.t1